MCLFNLVYGGGSVRGSKETERERDQYNVYIEYCICNTHMYIYGLTVPVLILFLKLFLLFFKKKLYNSFWKQRRRGGSRNNSGGVELMKKATALSRINICIYIVDWFSISVCYISTYVYMCMCVCVCVCVYIYMYIYIYISHVYTYRCVCVCVCMCVYR